MNEIFVGRQPILDREQNTVAYELLYRSGKVNFFPENTDGTKASVMLISNVFSDMGLQEIAGGLPVFLNFNREMLLSDLPSIDPATVVIEVLENVQVDNSVFEACVNLKNQGFTIALDDFILNDDTRQLLELASIIKIDWLADPVKRIKETCAILKPFSVRLLAEKIETEEEFRIARDLGFHLFQGFFFERPTIVKDRAVKAISSTLIEVMRLLQEDDVDFDELGRVISRDVALSLKLLKIINSASSGVCNKIESIKQAVVMIGCQELKRWFTLFMMTQVNDRCPAEILSTAFIRGVFGEKLACSAGKEHEAPSVFFLGLLSLIDAMLKCPMERAVAGLPLSDNLKEALIYEHGGLGPYLGIMKAYELAQNGKIQHYAEKIGIEPREVVQCYLDSLRESARYLRNICEVK